MAQQSPRKNQHLAVLLPRNLWRPDSASSACDNFYCRAPFSIFERKHHCRKCGGVFCNACTSRTTPLLDVSHLDFLNPPRDVPIASFESPISPILDSRVCDDCWDQIHGTPTTPRTPDTSRPSSSFSLFAKLPTHSVLPARPLQRKPSISSLETDSSTSSTPTPPRRTRARARLTVRTAPLPLPQELERSYGELDAYPLRRSSVVCKATGGGRWEPKPSPVLDGYRQPIPGGKAPFEIEMEREEAAERLRRANPVIRHGDFQYRFPKDPEPPALSRSPTSMSTF